MRVSLSMSMFLFSISAYLFFFSCTAPKGDPYLFPEQILLDYAEGFQVYQGEGYKLVEVSKAFPGTHKPFRYLILDNEEIEKPSGEFDAIITLPVSKVILTSTTHVPHLDYLEKTGFLIGFPDLDLISSNTVREMITKNGITDLGKGAQTNFEMAVELEPDWIMISTLGEDLKSLDLFKQAGIPAPINGEYMEQHPLGRAEWIKFTGALLGEWEKSNTVFEAIKTAYQSATRLIQDQQIEKPRVISGVMYKDIWYAPGADSWGAQLLEAAGGDYVFKTHAGTGSLQLSYEYVLDQAQEAGIWIGAADHKNLQEMGAADPRYLYFKAFQEGNVYTYTLKKGPKGGIEYFELGYLRPDLILQDLIKILYPEQLPNYRSYFYTRLDEK
ncbi:ABC transporter substrate-binding protein [Cecembia sp.]|uniref:ABC transporter substrate-binding protein n=1 Tax=Cecembia sp. TaxID=1898110 RepID=UPI0025C44E40|nr:ABC transporter substrate-binding protein [Cecembia sp.]